MRARSGPRYDRPGWLGVAKTGARKTASAPALKARALAESECTAQVMSQRGRFARQCAASARFEAARKAALKPAASTTLVAISKTFGPEAILPVIAAGHTVFGENRVQEAKAKWPALKAEFPHLALHLVGPLQSNKAREAVA